jgi:hypothetical protein
MSRFLLLAWWLLLATFGIVWAATEPTGAVQRRALRPGQPGRTGFTLIGPQQTGLVFTNVLSDLAAAENRVLSNGSGVAAGDFDNDGKVDLFFCSLNSQNKLFRNLGNWRFEDATAQAGLSFPPGCYRGAVFADLNGDGFLDLLVGSASQGVRCYVNDGHGKFKDLTSDAGTAYASATESLALADIDGNGTLDLYVANNRTDDIRDWLRIPVMLVNKKPTVPPQLKERLTFESGQLQEFGEPDVLYLNDGRGKFSAVSWTNGTFLDETGKPLSGPPLDWGLTATFRDLNGDGAPDLYVCNDYWTPDRLWLNTGDGHFRAAERLALRRTSASSMGADFGDINRDGQVDFFVVDMLSRSPELRKRQMVARRPMPTRIGDIDNRPQSPQNTLFLNRGDGTFAEIACAAGVAASEWSWSPVFLDVDLDGYEDLLITAGHRRDIQDIDANDRIRALPTTWRNQKAGADLQKAFVEAKREHAKLYPPLNAPVVAFRNRGDLHFEEVTTAWGLEHLGVNHGIAMADLDNDGDLDLVVNRLGAAAAVFRNDSTAPRVAVRLKGKAPNTQAIGARIELLGGAVTNQRAEVVSGGSYMSGSDPLRVFAPGAATQGLLLRVTWRSGEESEFGDVQPNSLYEISESAAPRRAPGGDSSKPAESPFFEDVTQRLAHTHAEETFDDFQRQPLLPRKLSQAGPGVAWFDVNQDGWDDLIIGSGKGGSLALFVNKNGTAFERLHTPPLDTPAGRDQSTVLGLRLESGETRLLVGSDNYEDGNSAASCVTILEPKGGSLEQPFPGHGSSVGPMALGDLDGDGDLDLFVGGRVVPGKYPQSASSLLFRQTGGRWALDAEATAVLKEVGLVNGAVWSDLNGDGLPELVLACEWGPVRVFRNQGGKIRDATAESGLAGQTGLWTGVTTGDLDGDGQLDIVAANWGWNSHDEASASQPLRLYYGDLMARGSVDILEAEFDSMRGKPAPRHLRESIQAALPFVAERFPTHLAWSRASMAEVIGERASAVKEVTVTTLASTVFFNRQGKFEAHPLPLEAQLAPAFAVCVADLDGDGHEDAFLSQNFFAFRGEESRLDSGRGLWLRGDGKGALRPVPGQLAGIKVYGEQRGAAVADFDHDGRLDVVVTQNAAPTRLYKNLRGRAGLRVRLQGPPGNRDGIGAVVRVRFGSQWGPAHELHAGSGYWSQDSAVCVLGLPREPTAVQVRWPGGRVTEQPVASSSAEVVVSYGVKKSI